MKRGMLFGIVGAFLLAASAQAQTTLCLWICNEFAPCDRPCRLYGGGPWTTCGAWGDCQGSGLAAVSPALSAPKSDSLQAEIFAPIDRCEPQALTAETPLSR
jgi:hypothetical protein